MSPFTQSIAIATGLLIALIFLQRTFHRLFQSILYTITNDKAITITIFSFLFLPGVLLHELSHFFMAKILFVRTGKISILPKVLSRDRLQLGYVEVYETDFIRGSLIGAAPFISGVLMIMFLSNQFLNITPVSPENLSGLWYNIIPLVKALFSANDVLLWVYLIFTISTTMLPSESDRRSWLPLILLIVGGSILFFSLGLNEKWVQFLVVPIQNISQMFNFAMLVSVFFHTLSTVILLFVYYILIKFPLFSYAK